MPDDADLPLEHAYVAPDAPSDGAAPAVVVLHGRGADERDLLPVARHLPDDLATVSLRAPSPHVGGYTWYDLDLSAGGLHESQPDPQGFRRSLDLVAESIPAAVDAYDLHAERVGLLGFSQGATSSFSLLLEDPGSFAWVAGLHGYLAAAHDDPDPGGTEGRPVFVSAGTADRVIPAVRAEGAADRLAALGYDVTFERFATGHGIGPDELEALVEFVGGHYRG